MFIRREDLTELQHLQEDIAEHFWDEYGVSGETYWTCVETMGTAKLAELRGEIVFEQLKPKSTFSSKYRAKKTQVFFSLKTFFKKLKGVSKISRQKERPSFLSMINKSEEKLVC